MYKTINDYLLLTQKYKPEILKDFKKNHYTIVKSFVVDHSPTAKEYRVHLVEQSPGRRGSKVISKIFLHFLIDDQSSKIYYERFADSDSYENRTLMSAEVYLLYLYLQNKEEFHRVFSNNS